MPAKAPPNWMQWIDQVFPTEQRWALLEDEPWQHEAIGDYCPVCGETKTPAGVGPKGCPYCRRLRLPWQRLYRLGKYEPPLSHWVQQMKFSGRWTWARHFGGLLSTTLQASSEPLPTMVCEVPMHWRRRWSRGYNQASLMARSLAQDLAVPWVGVLVRHRATIPQTHVHPDDRAANVRQSVRLAWPGADLTDQHVLLVDDVKTTGATLRMCARVLREAGAKQITVAVAAVADQQPG